MTDAVDKAMASFETDIHDAMEAVGAMIANRVEQDLKDQRLSHADIARRAGAMTEDLVRQVFVAYGDSLSCFLEELLNSQRD